MALTFQLGINTATLVTLFPEFDYKAMKKQIRSETRTRSGKLFVHRWANYGTWKFTAEFIPSSIANTINSWWATNTSLLFLVVSDTNVEVNSVMLFNKNEPVSQFSRPYDDFYDGVIELEQR